MVDGSNHVCVHVLLAITINSNLDAVVARSIDVLVRVAVRVAPAPAAGELYLLTIKAVALGNVAAAYPIIAFTIAAVTMAMIVIAVIAMIAVAVAIMIAVTILAEALAWMDW